MLENDKRLESTESKNNRQWSKLSYRRHLDKILFGIGCVYLLGVLAWLATQKNLHLPFITKSSKETVASDPKISHADAEFIAYMQRSLAEIDTRSLSTQQEISEPKSNATLPLISLPGNQATKIVQRVYIPSVEGQSNKSNLEILPPPPPISSATEKIPTPLPPSPQAVSAKPKASLPVLPALSGKNQNTLIGLIEFENRSAALFSLNGATQRVYLGETIGGTAWVLKSVNNEKVGIARNGEIRSIIVGEKF